MKLGRGKPLLNFLPNFTSFTQIPTSFRTRSGQVSQVSHAWHVLEGRAALAIYSGLQPSLCVRARRSALSAREDFGETCLGPQPTHVQPAWLWRRQTPKAAQTCETCGTWPELVLKLVGVCMKLVKLGRGKPLVHFLASFTSFTIFTQIPVSGRDWAKFHKFHISGMFFWKANLDTAASYRNRSSILASHLWPLNPRQSCVDCPPSFVSVPVAPHCLLTKTFGETCLGPHVQPAWLWRRLPPKAAQTCETCETWPELILKLVGACVKLVKLGRGKPLLHFFQVSRVSRKYQRVSGRDRAKSHKFHMSGMFWKANLDTAASYRNRSSSLASHL